MNRKKGVVAALCSLMLASACGGGGGGAGTGGGGTGGGGTGGGGTGGGGTQASSTTAQGTQGAIISVVEATNIVGGLSGMSQGMEGTSVRLLGTKLNLKKGLSGKQAETVNCSDGGTMTISETSSGITISFNNCAEREDGVRAVRNGTLSSSISGSTMNVQVSNLSVREYNASTGRLLSDVSINGSFSGTLVSSANCSYTNNVVANLSFTGREDFNGDGTFDEDGAITLSNYRMVYQNVSLNRYCEPISYTVQVQSGSSASVRNNKTGDALSYSIPSGSSLNLGVEFTPQGMNLQISGSCNISTNCFSGVVSYSTINPIFWGHDNVCPSRGAIRVTGAANATFTYTSEGGLQIDNGNDGTVDITYRSCEEPRVCR